MYNQQTKVKVFIGSSVEGKEYAEILQSQLEYDVEATIWNQNIFHVGHTVYDSLLSVLDKFQIAVFIFTPDDRIISRNEEFSAIRDNLIYELGLFTGKLDKGKTFFLYPRSCDMKIPSDLYGVIKISFDDKRTDGNIKAALNSSVVEIKQIANSILETSLAKKRKVLSATSNICKISIPKFHMDLFTDTVDMVLLNEAKLQQMLFDLCNDLGIHSIPYLNDINFTGDEIHIGGPATNFYVNNYLSVFFPTIRWRCTADHYERYSKKVSEKLNPKIFEIIDKDKSEGFSYGNSELLESNDFQEFSVLIKITEKDFNIGKKNIHMLFGSGHVGTEAAVRHFLECYESLYDNYRNNHYFIAFPVDKRSGIVKRNELIDLTNKMFVNT